jgi:hypothetical protein
MNAEKLSDMTLDEFNKLVEQIVDRRLQSYFKPQDERTVSEILADIDRNMWIPPANAKSSLELLREARDAQA